MPQLNHSMSIRIFSDGHSFPEQELAAQPHEPLVILYTPRTVLLPAHLYTVEEAERVLSLCGLPPKANECVVCSQEVEGMVAVMAIREELFSRLPASTRFTSPLLIAPQLSEGLWIHPCRGLLFIKLWLDGELRLAEVVQAASDDEILYYALQLLRNSGRKRLSLHLQGNCSPALKKQLKRTFSPLLCE